MLVVDKTGVILVANEVAHAQLGNHHQQLIGRTHWEAAVPRVSAAIDAVLMKGEAQRKELTLPADLSVELNVTPIFGTHSEVVGAVAVLHDVSQFRQVERMRSEFVANVSHELRTPITAVRGFAETLLDGAIENPELRRQFVQIIYDEADRLNHLVVDLLELSKIESGHSIFHFEPADLGVLAENAADTLRHQAEQHGLALEVHLPEAPVVAEVAAERILQVLVNLIGNAIAYTPAPGRVDLTVLDGEATVQLVVQDTGIGIPQADIPRIFERFYRVDKDRSRRTGGTGLGLAIVKHIVEVHHGNIQVESQVGKGSIFRVNLPKRQMPNAAHPTGSAGNNFTNESQAHMLLS
ncbi:hypothetical protein GCM10025857_14210 [Alicyclobacillus contaminans]|nr:hypothetical protein GCM10025857_14210 [Alicyclobacillus contaminans]